jgi:hypothetical protein
MAVPNKIYAMNNVGTDGGFSLVKRENRQYENITKGEVAYHLAS